jgi:hypothetical protein
MKARSRKLPKEKGSFGSFIGAFSGNSASQLSPVGHLVEKI